MGFESVTHVAPRAALALRQMQGEVITGELITVLVNLHIDCLFCIGGIIQKENDFNIIDLGIKCSSAAFQMPYKCFKTDI